MKKLVKEAKQMLAKQEKIKEAWGERYELYKDYIDENGWIENQSLGSSSFVLSEPFERDYGGDENKPFDRRKIIFRPTSLKGIES